MITAIDGLDVTPKVGSYVLPDGWRGWGGLLGESDWDAAAFRIPVNSLGPITSLAVNVELTGRMTHWRGGGRYVRVRIIFVGDCEPDQTTLGWMRID